MNYLPLFTVQEIKSPQLTGCKPISLSFSQNFKVSFFPPGMLFSQKIIVPPPQFLENIFYPQKLFNINSYTDNDFRV